MPLIGTAASVEKKVGHSAALQGWSINVGLGQKRALQQQQSAAGVMLKFRYIFNISVSVLMLLFFLFLTSEYRFQDCLPFCAYLLYDHHPPSIFVFVC